MNVRNRSSAEGKGKGSAVLIATLIVAMMVAASASLFFIGGDESSADDPVLGAGRTIDITGKDIGEIQDEIQNAIDNARSGGKVTVVGDKDDADETLYLLIPTGKTVVWNAGYTGTVSGVLVHINSETKYDTSLGVLKGTFRLACDRPYYGGLYNTGDDSTALRVDSGNVITAGHIEANGDRSLGIYVGEGNVTMINGSVYAAGEDTTAISVGSDTAKGYAMIKGGTICAEGTNATAIHVISGAAAYLHTSVVSGDLRADDGFIVSAEYYYLGDGKIDSDDWFTVRSNSGAAVSCELDADGRSLFFKNGDHNIRWGIYGHIIDITHMSDAGQIEGAISQTINDAPGGNIIVIGENCLVGDLNVDLSDAAVIWAAEFKAFNNVRVTGPGTFILTEDGSFEVLSLEFTGCDAELNGELYSYCGPDPDDPQYDVFFELSFVAKDSTVTMNDPFGLGSLAYITIDDSVVTINGDQELGCVFLYVIGDDAVLTINGDTYLNGNDALIMAGYLEYDHDSNDIKGVRNGGTIVINGDIVDGKTLDISAIGDGTITINGDLTGYDGSVVAGGCMYGFDQELLVTERGTIVINGDLLFYTVCIEVNKNSRIEINGDVLSDFGEIMAGFAGYDHWTNDPVEYNGGVIVINGDIVSSGTLNISAIGDGSITINGGLTVYHAAVAVGGCVYGSDQELIMAERGTIVINGDLLCYVSYIEAYNSGSIEINGDIFSDFGEIMAGFAGYDPWTDGLIEHDGGTIVINGNIGDYDVDAHIEISAIGNGAITINGDLKNEHWCGDTIKTGAYVVNTDMDIHWMVGGGSIMINGDILWKRVFISSYYGGPITINGDILSQNSYIQAGWFEELDVTAYSSEIKINGSIAAYDWADISVYGEDSVLTVTGSVSADYSLFIIISDGSVTINGDILLNDDTSLWCIDIGAGGILTVGGDVIASLTVIDGGVAVIDGMLIAPGNEIIFIDNGTETALSIGSSAIRGTGVYEAYYEYSDGTSFVYLLDADAKTVTAGSQNGTIEEGSTDSAVFEITTANIAGGKFMTVKWYEADGLTATTAPIGITAGTSAILNNTAVLTMTSDPASVAGTYYFTVTAAGVESVVVTLTVDPVTIPPMLDGITVSSTPDKTSYTVGDVLDLTGLEITATYSDGSSAEVSGYTTYPANGTVFSAAGIVTISITYTEGGVERTTAFNVTVAKATGSVLDCIGVTTLPYKTVYFVGEALDITGLVVSSTYTDGTTEEAVGYTTDPIDGAILDKIGRIPVIIVYTVGSVTKYSLYTVTVNALPAEPVLESIAVTTLPDKIVYTVGDVLDLTGMSVTAVLSSRNTGPAFYTTDPADGTVLSTEGTITITVSYTFFEVTATATFDVTVNPAACPDPVLESIAVTAMPAKTSYTVGDMLNLAGLEITAVYDDGSSAVVTSFVTDTANGAVLAAGTLTVTVTYIEDGITATTAFTVTVNTAPVEPPVINVPPVIVVILVAVVLIFTLLRR